MKRILVVEEDDGLREMILRVLTDSGYEPVGAETFDEASELLEQPFDAAVIGLSIGGKPTGGLKLLMKAKEVEPGIVVVVTSASHFISDDPKIDLRQAVMDAGAEATLDKPFDFEVLKKALGSA